MEEDDEEDKGYAWAFILLVAIGSGIYYLIA
jgi:hypothetical protein